MAIFKSKLLVYQRVVHPPLGKVVYGGVTSKTMGKPQENHIQDL
jgi:hypothetical protein